MEWWATYFEATASICVCQLMDQTSNECPVAIGGFLRGRAKLFFELLEEVLERWTLWRIIQILLEVPCIK